MRKISKDEYVLVLDIVRSLIAKVDDDYTNLNEVMIELQIALFPLLDQIIEEALTQFTDEQADDFFRELIDESFKHEEIAKLFGKELIDEFYSNVAKRDKEKMS